MIHRDINSQIGLAAPTPPHSKSTCHLQAQKQATTLVTCRFVNALACLRFCLLEKKRAPTLSEHTEYHQVFSLPCNGLTRPFLITCSVSLRLVIHVAAFAGPWKLLGLVTVATVNPRLEGNLWSVAFDS